MQTPEVMVDSMSLSSSNKRPQILPSANAKFPGRTRPLTVLFVELANEPWHQDKTSSTHDHWHYLILYKISHSIKPHIPETGHR